VKSRAGRKRQGHAAVRPDVFAGNQALPGEVWVFATGLGGGDQYHLLLDEGGRMLNLLTGRLWTHGALGHMANSKHWRRAE
jgi:hypothetical protein